MSGQVRTNPDDSVTLEIGGQAFRFFASVERVANLEKALDDASLPMDDPRRCLGIEAMLRMLERNDQKAIHLALSHFLVEGDPRELDGLPVAQMLELGPRVVEAALALPSPNEAEAPGMASTKRAAARLVRQMREVPRHGA